MSCRGKEVYSSEAEALCWASRILMKSGKRRLKKKDSDNCKLRAYYCVECRGWHLTKLKKEV